jgi:hypothetical protein
MLGIDERSRTLLDRLGDLAAHEFGGRGAHHRPEIGRLVGGIAEFVGLGEIDEAIDEFGVEGLVHVDALDPAAGLARIEEGTIDQILDRMGEIGIRAHVSRVLPAEFEPGADEALADGALDRLAAIDRTRETNVIDARVADDLGGIRMVGVQDLEHARWQTGRVGRFSVALGDQGRLVRMLQQHHVPCGQSRNHRVDRGEIGVVPGRDHEDEAQGIARDVPLEPALGFGRHVGESHGCYRQHVARALLEAAHLPRRLGNRAAHLPGQFLGDRLALAQQRVDELGQGGDARR